ncbi:MAG: cytochrome c oxidase assembly factor Coa1 family protein [Thainema sp.]
MSEDRNFDEPNPFPSPDEVAPASPNKWILPVGCTCCGCIIVSLIALGLGVAGLGGAVWRVVRSTGTHQVYQLAAAAVESNSTISDVLGEPVEAGWVSKSVERYRDPVGGRVCLRFSVNGADRSGSAYAEGTNNTPEATWQLHQLTVAINGETEAFAVVPLPDNQPPLCPDFDQPDSESEPTPPEAESITGSTVQKLAIAAY